MFAIRTEVIDGTAICRVQGDADAANSAALREALVEVTAHGRVILDFSGVPFIDSAGLACVITGARRVHAANGDIVLSNARRAVRRLLGTVCVERVLPITESIEEAFERLDELAASDPDSLRTAPPLIRS